jgi:ABC-type lipoprotein export system ATPase subunit
MTVVASPPAELTRCRSVGVVHPGGVTALEAIDLRIAPGERLALWGPSGSGKTTLLHVVGGLTAPTTGRVERRTRRIAFVFQTAALLPHFTALENVAFAARAADDPAGPTPLELLALVGLEAKAEALPAELSGGEAQRTAIARALGQRPELLLCDEPTGQLDSDTGGRVLDLVDALAAEHAFALVIATHDPDVAARCERTVELADGRVVADEVAT